MPILNMKLIGASGRGLILLSALLALTGGVTYTALDSAYQKVIEYQAQAVAEIVAHQAAVSRTVYAKQAVDKLTQDGRGAHIEAHKHPGFVPLPAQFLKLMAQETLASGTELYSFKPLSKWHIEPSQGLQDEFQRWAWAELEKQDQAEPSGPIAWRGVYRFEKMNGINTFRYLRADPASSASCVECHNAHERNPEVMAQRLSEGTESGKRWKQHQLLGAIEVDIPLDNVEAIIADQTQRVLAVMLAVLGLTVILMAWFLYRNVSCFRNLTRLSWIATHDQLTGLLNRRGFSYRLDELTEATRFSGTVSVLGYLDLDHLKSVNDIHGHAAGDQVLVRVADLLRDELRNEDVVSRVGGDEFAVVLVSCKLAKAEAIARAVCERIASEPFVFDGQATQVGISIGLVELNAATVEASNYRKLADEALYAAKHAGRGQVVCHQPGAFT